MKHRLFLYLLFVASYSLSSLGQTVPPLTLSACYEKAETHYPLIRQYGLLERTQTYTLSNLSKSWLPQVTLNARASYQTDVTHLPFDVAKMSALIPGFQAPELSKDQYRVVAEIHQPIWNGGETRAAKEVARARTQSERAQVETQLYTLRSRINQLYFGILLYGEYLRQNMLLEQNMLNNKERVETLMDNGLANPSDIDRLDVELLRIRQQEVELRSQFEALCQLLGFFINHPVTPDTPLQEPDVPQKTWTNDISRPELRAFEAQREWYDAQNRQITASLMPRFGAFVQGGYGRPGLDMLDNDFKPFCVLGVSMTWNFSGLYTQKNHRRQLSVQRQGIDVQRETFLFNTRLQLLQQDADIRKYEKLEQTDADIVRLRTQIKEAAEVKLQEGVISVNDLVNEIYAESLARQSAATHRLQRLLTLYERQYTTH